MKRIETSNKSNEELATMLGELRATMTKLQFELAEKKLKDTTQLGKTKRDIARILTALHTQKSLIANAYPTKRGSLAGDKETIPKNQ